MATKGMLPRGMLSYHPSIKPAEIGEKGKGKWTEEEDKRLAALVVQYKGKNWKKVAEGLNGRTDVQCLHRWQKVLNPELVKGPWRHKFNEKVPFIATRYIIYARALTLQNFPIYSYVVTSQY